MRAPAVLVVSVLVLTSCGAETAATGSPAPTATSAPSLGSLAVTAACTAGSKTSAATQALQAQTTTADIVSQLSDAQAQWGAAADFAKADGETADENAYTAVAADVGNLKAALNAGDQASAQAAINALGTDLKAIPSVSCAGG